jgi:hypothetical protein
MIRLPLPFYRNSIPPLPPVFQGQGAVGGGILSAWFDGDDYVQCGTGGLLNPSGSFSLVCKLYISAVQSYKYPVRKLKYGLYLTPSNQVYFETRNATDTAWDTSNYASPIIHNAWNTIIAIADLSTTTKYIYLNGNAGTTAAKTDAVASDNTQFSIPGISYLTGSVRDVALYSKALSSGERAQIDGGGDYPTDSLSGHWLGYGITDAKWIDQSGNGYNGTVYGNPTIFKT